MWFWWNCAALCRFGREKGFAYIHWISGQTVSAAPSAGPLCNLFTVKAKQTTWETRRRPRLVDAPRSPRGAGQLMLGASRLQHLYLFSSTRQKPLTDALGGFTEHSAFMQMTPRPPAVLLRDPIWARNCTSFFFNLQLSWKLHWMYKCIYLLHNNFHAKATLYSPFVLSVFLFLLTTVLLFALLHSFLRVSSCPSWLVCSRLTLCVFMEPRCFVAHYNVLWE